MVHYIGWYIGENEDALYTGNVPGKLKMRYVARKILEAGKALKILSLAERKKKGFYGKKEYKTKEGVDVLYTGGYAGGNKIGRYLNDLLKKLQFVLYVIFNVKKNDTIILYHSVAYTKLLANLKRIFKRSVVIEVEEIYGYSATVDRPWVNKEIETIKAMENFIVVNAGIPVELGIAKEHYVVSYGVCDIPKCHVDRFKDGKIHVVYAGTIERRKLGALTAAEAARYLPENYIMHIIGFGAEENIQYLQEKIHEVNEACGDTKVRYEGYYTGSVLDDFLFQCHIGLSSNVMRPNFANHSFPSKVITYMCHDLSVVLGYAKAFYDVPIAKDWSFYMEHNPQQIAEAIQKTQIAPKGYYTDLIQRMDDELINFIKRVC